VYKLFIAEDMDIIRNTLKNSIDWAELDVIVSGAASNGKEALELFEEEVPQILLTDIRMPIMDGIRLIIEVKEKYPAIECIILTGYTDFNYAQNAIKLGVRDYVLKPVNIDELKASVKKAIDNIKQNDENLRQKKLIGESLKGKFPNLNQEHVSILDGDMKNRKIAEKAIGFIKANVFSKITVTEVADEVQLNPKYLNTLFKQVTGESISKYIIWCKLEKAACLLKDPNMKVNEVCDKLGYLNLDYFRDIFTRHYGVTPSEYKKRVL